MENININEMDMLIILKGHNYDETIYNKIPLITYTGNELFSNENIVLFENLNDREENYDLIIIGKKIVKNQIENIKKNILQKKACQLHPIIFESDEIIDDNLVLSINYYDIYLSGKFKMEEIMFKLHGRNWVEIL
tara:strand:+ start:2142 stop:2546 length:405 start_codon:yes stop_codon:yes gene_type:complete